MRKIVLDVETKNMFSDVGGNDPTLLDMSLVCIYDSLTDSYSSYLEAELPNLWPILEQSDVLIGFNSDHFDIPLLNKYYLGDLTQKKSLDLLAEVKNVLGRRIKLDTIAEATLGVKKSGNGLQAIAWWRNGEIDKVRQYCIDDVRITKEIYEYALANGHLKYKDWDGGVLQIRLNTSKWEEKKAGAVTQSLPF
ncbi:MAG: ribonuclease H-like domain-containing protein [Parcubacteria group bacterium]|nr:ribonuclease H-like domain-containing protein [Parcubacteria group bacterium]